MNDEQQGMILALTAAVVLLMSRESKRDDEFLKSMVSDMDAVLGEFSLREDSKQDAVPLQKARKHFHNLVAMAEDEASK